MAKKKKSDASKPAVGSNTVIENAGVMQEQPITQTLTKNYMPYAMSVIVSRAIPEIDGFKPSHRKILYTMYKMGLINGGRVKSANAVGEVMKLHPHGDQAIYETLVRLSRGNEALLHPYIDSKGNFGKSYSRDMAYAAARYTEVKLLPLCHELFADLDKDAVDMVDSYDGRMKEPTLLPVSYPSILVNSNVGIAVGMASSICPFNLAEVCETAIALIKNPEHVISDTLKAPDFPGGGEIIYNAGELEKIYTTGRGSVRVRGRYRIDKSSNCLEIVAIPPTTTVEAIIDKVVDLVKSGKVREIADVRDETDLGGLKITLDLKRGVDGEKLIRRLYKLTPLEDTFSCNFNVLIGSSPQVMGIGALLNEWTAFRLECIRRRLFFDLKKKRDKLHLLQGLAKILLDIDKAIRIVRETEEEREVVPNLMIGFGIDEVQAEYVAEIKLRQLNREYILKRIEEIDDLKNSIVEMEETLKSRSRMLAIITSELKAVSKKFGQPRRSAVIIDDDVQETQVEEAVPDYPVHLFFTREGYFKKITPQSWRMSGDHKLKEGDEVVQAIEAGNRTHLLFFSDKGQVYKAVASDFDDTKASVLGDFVAAKLGFEDGENSVYMAVTNDYKGFMFFGFENGKVAKIALTSYETKTRRKKLTSAYSTKEPLVGMLSAQEDVTLLLKTKNGKVMLLDTARILSKTVRDSVGVQAVTVKGKNVVTTMKIFEDGMLDNAHHYTPRSIPSAGYTPREEDIMTQITLEPQE
ncbi:MAG: DNA gyrase subunit A [Candidatus Fimivivens sp.]